ncbi:MAG: quercetin dioxygenase-like cupin family protein [Cyclobacteriaceae bacterium]|jgi:quercetin dioxygenase-like cupin family protein
MTKLIFLISICCIASSCNQNTKSKDINPNTSIDTIEDKASLTTDTSNVEIDIVKVSPDNYKVLLENEYVRIVEYALKTGEKDNLHNHPANTEYVVSGGNIRVYPENGQPVDNSEVTGTVFWADKTTKHYVENIGNTTVKILLHEIKSVK